MASLILQVNNLVKHYPMSGGRVVHAVDGVSFTVAKGETLSLVGESGCGKSTVARAVLRLVAPTSGEIILDGNRIDQLSAEALRPSRRRIQIVFQDPFASLNPRMRVRSIIAEPIRNFRIERGEGLKRRVNELLEIVRLPHDAADRFPHEFSGGQRQRIGIARALAAKPDLIVCDEAVSALDVSVKAQIVNLLQDIQRDLGLALLFISHDLAIVEHMTQRVAVMYLGKIVEQGERRDIFSSAKHPYTQALLSAVPTVEPGRLPNRILLSGDVPSPVNPPSGCRFHTRCPYAFERCKHEEPRMKSVGPQQFAACHLYDAPTAGQGQ